MLLYSYSLVVPTSKIHLLWLPPATSVISLFNQHRPHPAGPLQPRPLQLVPVQLVQSAPVLEREAELETKAMQSGAGHQPLSLPGGELGLQEVEEERRC